MDALSGRIRNAPLSYLPEQSLALLWYFRQGFDLRYAMEGKSYQWSDDNHRRSFAQWVRKRFGATTGRALSHFPLICSFSSNDVEALSNYFALLEEFCNEDSLHFQSELDRKVKKLDFAELLIAARANPQIYAVDGNFFGYCAFLMGEQRAHENLQLPSDSGRTMFDEFKRWIEEKENRALPRPWYKVIAFWSGGYQVGPDGAFSLFYKWLDEYAAENGMPNLFRPTL